MSESRLTTESRAVQHCCRRVIHAVSLLLLLSGSARVISADEQPPFTDYCERLTHEIQGRKHGFMAGNVTYYIGGFHAVWNPVEDETIGLTHPFHHDLRSRGVGLGTSKVSGSENTGVGNDYGGWEFYKDTKVLYGSVVVDGKTYENPKPKSMLWRPDKLICKYQIGDVEIREEKFIAGNDAAASIITSSKPILLKFKGHSFYHRNSLSSTAAISYASSNNVIEITEGGTVSCRPDPDRVTQSARCVYDGMTTALSASRSFSKTYVSHRDDRAVQHYEFTVPCDEDSTVVSWAMHDKANVAVKSAKDILRHHEEWLSEKTLAMNRLLNEQVPWFRCPDEKFVDVYYYLWSLYLMYYIDVGEGWEQENHTQTAVNNFLGMHRYDAAFQIKVGAWASDKSRFAYGNVLTWKHLTKNGRFRQMPNGLKLLSDNKGISWHSGAYGGETSEHVLGAWQIYEHTGDVEFLKQCYEDHFRTLFWDRVTFFQMNVFEVGEVLEKMAALTGHVEDVEHWRSVVRRDPEFVRLMFDQRWEANGVKDFFAAPKNEMLMTNAFWSMRSRHFPNEYAKRMVENWTLNRERGFYGAFFPLAMAKESMTKFNSPADLDFGYTPDTAYFTLDGMFRQDMREFASQLTLNHLENYNFHRQWKIPVAPEAYRRDLSLFGDQYSNFNAGKILLYLEGLAGIRYSVPDDVLEVKPAVPKVWDWMEVRFPIAGQWTRLRYSKDGVRVNGSPLRILMD